MGLFDSSGWSIPALGWSGRGINAGDAVGYMATQNPYLSLLTGGYQDQVQRQAQAGVPGTNYQEVADKNKAARSADLEEGRAEGRRLFYDDADMKDIRSRLTDLSKGYNGEELGALRKSAQDELQNNRSTYLRQLSSRAGQGGVGGARAAAIRANADQGFQRTKAENERKMLLDNSSLVRKGTEDLNNFTQAQKYGELGTGLGYAQLGVSDRAGVMAAQAAERAAQIANQPKDKGVLGNLFGGLFG